MSDIELIEEYCVSQKDIYFEELYGRYEQKIYSKCITMLKDQSAASEALQEIFIKVFLNLTRFQGKSKFSTWVYSITYNHCIDRLRRIQKRQLMFRAVEVVPDEMDEPVDHEMLSMEYKILEVVLDKLKSEDKAILLMKYRDDKKIKEISEVLSVSASAVKMRLKRAKSKVMTLYKEMKKIEA